jgi:hypothetical protein
MCHSWIASLALFGMVCPWLALAGDFALLERTEFPPETGRITYYELKFATNAAVFLPPRNWRVRPMPAERAVSLEHPSDGIRLICHFSPQSRLPPARANWDKHRQSLTNRFKRTIIREEFEDHAGNFSGHGYWVEYRVANDYAMGLDLAVLSIPGYLLEIQLYAPLDQIPRFQRDFTSFLTSFRLLPAVKPP